MHSDKHGSQRVWEKSFHTTCSRKRNIDTTVLIMWNSNYSYFTFLEWSTSSSHAHFSKALLFILVLKAALILPEMRNSLLFMYLYSGLPHQARPVQQRQTCPPSPRTFSQVSSPTKSFILKICFYALYNEENNREVEFVDKRLPDFLNKTINKNNDTKTILWCLQLCQAKL